MAKRRMTAMLLLRVQMTEAPEIPGAEEVIGWFGCWPTFHDAEVVSINLNRRSGCRVVVNAFRTTPTVEHATVTFLLEGFPMDPAGVVNSRIEFFNHQNVLSGLQINQIPEGYEMVMESIFGVAGTLTASRMTVELKPA
ncbi:MAG TPA: hypothetical protein VGL82_13750 [Bryobacteraceae bacterium]